MTSAISSSVRIRFGIFGCDVVRITRRAVAVMPRVLAISRKAGPITMSSWFLLLRLHHMAGTACFASEDMPERPRRHPGHAHSRRSGPELRRAQAGVSVA